MHLRDAFVNKDLTNVSNSFNYLLVWLWRSFETIVTSLCTPVELLAKRSEQYFGDARVSPQDTELGLLRAWSKDHSFCIS